jgi:hypothetical protein
MRRRLLAIGSALPLALACATPAPPKQTEAAPCVPEFPYRDGWLGGDAAYSVPLESTRSVWLFGDSFVATEREAEPDRRWGEQLVFGNTIALSTCAPGGPWQIEYHVRGPDTRAPFFAPPWGGEAGHFYWPLDGFAHDGALYVGLLEVSADWTLHGTTLARVENPRDPPARWRTAYVRMSEHASLFPGFAMVVRDDYVYMFASIVRGAEPRRRVLTRVSLSELARRTQLGEPLETAFETYARDGRYRRGLSEADAAVLMHDSATEMSVRYHPAIESWVAIYSELTPFGSSAISYRTAQALNGPWSAPQQLYEIPEVTRGSEHFDPETVCYAAKEHAAFRAAGRGPTPLLITYVCNSLNEETLYRNLELYRPVVLREAFEIPPASSPSR